MEKFNHSLYRYNINRIIKNKTKVYTLFGLRTDLFALIFVSTILSCSSLKYGTYEVKKFRAKDNNIYITGKLHEYGATDWEFSGVVKANDTIIGDTDDKGNFKIKRAPGRYRFTGAAMNYFFVTTNRIKLKPGDSLQIDFFLKLNDTKLID